MAERTCVTCGATLPAPSGRGRPRIYCGDACRMKSSARIHGPCVDCGKTVTFGPASSIDRVCRSCRTMRDRTRCCPQCGVGFTARTREQVHCSRECSYLAKRVPGGRAERGLRDGRLGGYRRKQVLKLVRDRTDSPVCPLCGVAIDRTLRRSGKPDPLSSCVDDWFPRKLGGDPLDPDNCVEVHRVCNGVKGSTWPVTDGVRQRCRELVMERLASQSATWRAMVVTPYAGLFQA